MTNEEIIIGITDDGKEMITPEGNVDIQNAFDLILKDDNSIDFKNSLHKTWKRTKKLSDKQLFWVNHWYSQSLKKISKT